jgi:hypothetical protein
MYREGCEGKRNRMTTCLMSSQKQDKLETNYFKVPDCQKEAHDIACHGRGGE